MTGLWLGIETTAPTGGAALVRDGGTVAEEYFPVVATHSEKLLPGIAGLMDSSGFDGKDIDGIAVSAGPGSYTGVRIGIATALGLARGWSTGVVAVDTLRILAAATDSPGPVLACIRARKNEVFAAVYGSSPPGETVIVEPGVYTADAIIRRLAGMRGVTAVGGGLIGMTLPEGIQRVDAKLDSPRPSTVAVLGSIAYAEDGFDEYPVPLYLRGFNEKAREHVP
jgi:tRNA threonylcarbamoyladenosine biosynthesis protein TsaB